MRGESLEKAIMLEIGEWKSRTWKTRDTMAGYCTGDYGNEATGAAYIYIIYIYIYIFYKIIIIHSVKSQNILINF